MKLIKARMKVFFHWIRCHQILTDRYISAYQPGMSVITSIWCYDCNKVFYDNSPKFEKIKTHLSFLLNDKTGLGEATKGEKNVKQEVD